VAELINKSSGFINSVKLFHVIKKYAVNPDLRLLEQINFYSPYFRKIRFNSALQYCLARQ
jgi:hypothetical protein